MKQNWPPEILAGQASRLEMVVAVLGLSDKEIAERLGCSPQSWNHYTKGTRPFWAPYILELRKMLPISLDWLYFGDLNGMSPRVLETLYGRAAHVPRADRANTQPVQASQKRTAISRNR